LAIGRRLDTAAWCDRIGRGVSAMPAGIVKFFNTTKGYGFIAPDGGGKDVFVHITALQRSNIATLTEGQKVSFDLSPGRDGRISADNLKLI
jgi:cold shock protein